jgi:uncharacterized protein YjiS (DUF1127 family)
MTSYPSSLSASSVLGIGHFAGIGRRACAAFRVWRTSMRQRRELLMLNDVELRELSLTAAEIDRETRKLSWESIDLTCR